MSKLKNFLSEKKENKNEKIINTIMDFFTENPSPPDEEVHDLAEELGLEPDDFEAMIYSILGSILGYGRSREKKVTEKDVDKKEFELGMKIEMEHTTNKRMARKIALDHLTEIPDYYTRLVKMEKEAEKK